MIKKPYILFMAQFSFSLGGWSDFINSFETVEEAIKFSEKYAESTDKRIWVQIVDLRKLKIVHVEDFNK